MQLTLDPTFAKFCGELLCQFDNYLLAVFSPLPLQQLYIDPIANLPVELCKLGID